MSPPRTSRRSSARRSSSTARARCGRERGRCSPRSDGGHVAFGTKAFANVAVLRLLREEGIRADVASAGELEFARAAGFGGDEIVVHGNNKGEAFLRDAAAEGATVVLDAPDEAVMAAAAGVQRVLVRVTLGVDADTHEAIRTGHHGSKFGLPPAQARTLIEDALARGLDVLGPPRSRRIAARRLRCPGRDDRAARVVRRVVPRRARLDGARRRSRRRLRNPPQPRRARARRGGAGRERRRDGAARVRRGGSPRAGGLARAGALARRHGRCDALSRRRRQAPARAHVGRRRRRHVRQPASAALRRASTPRSPPTAPTSPRPSASASRGCTASRATCSSTTSSLPGATPRRPARRARDGRLHARDGVELQRRHAARRPCSSAAARRG